MRSKSVQPLSRRPSESPRSSRGNGGELVLLQEESLVADRQRKTTEVKAAFDMQGIMVRLDQLLPLRCVSASIRASRKFKTMAASVKEVGIIEPLVVYPQKGGKYTVLDGNMRLSILKELGLEETLCLVSTDDEAYTYNDKVNRLAPIQEHRMILKAVENGVPEERIAAALAVDVSTIRRSQSLLVGICPEAVDLLKDRAITRGALGVLKRVRPMRQVEMAELMVAVGNYSHAYGTALLAATCQDQLVDAEKDTGAKVVRPEDLTRMEREMDELGKGFVSLEQSHGQNVLNLVVARGYVIKLLENGRIVRFLATKCPEVLAEFQRIVESTSLEG